MIKNFSAHLAQVFADENNDYESFRNLMFDRAEGKEIVDEASGRKISNKEADAKIRQVAFSILGLGEKFTDREYKRAMKHHGAELFEVIEEVIDVYIETGFKDSEFFNDFVDQRNLAAGDSQEFYTEKDIVLSVAKVSGDHHDLTVQTLNAGESYTVTTSKYAVKVGGDTKMFLTGRKDWSDFVQHAARAFVVKAQQEMYSEVMNVGSKIPNAEQFNLGGELSASTKDQFDTLIEDVMIANDNVPVYILGTRTALKKLNALADIDWISEDQKKEMAAMGRLGSYEGVTLMEVPQRFEINDTATKLVDSTKLLIMPAVENKFVKFVDVGETEINEVTDANDTMDERQTYEIQREMGISTQCGRYFGVWTIG